MNLAVEIKKLTKLYDQFVAVDHVSFTIESGKTIALLGPNGAGKSTIVKMLVTLLPPSSGTAVIAGHDIVKDPEGVRNHIGYVPQLISADGELTGYENLSISGKLYGLSRSKREKRIQEVIDIMGLEGVKDSPVKRYSGGMIRRLEIAQAFLHEPKVLFLDEPTVGLDPSARRAVWDKILDLQKDFGTTLLMTTHDMDEADLLADKIAFMYQGRILTIESPKKLKEAIGPAATLDDVFLKFTGTTIQEGGDFSHANEIRRTISNLD